MINDIAKVKNKLHEFDFIDIRKYILKGDIRHGLLVSYYKNELLGHTYPHLMICILVIH